MRKRILSVFLAAIMACSTIPQTAYAAEVVGDSIQTVETTDEAEYIEHDHDHIHVHEEAEIVEANQETESVDAVDVSEDVVEESLEEEQISEESSSVEMQESTDAEDSEAVLEETAEESIEESIEEISEETSETDIDETTEESTEETTVESEEESAEIDEEEILDDIEEGTLLDEESGEELASYVFNYSINTNKEVQINSYSGSLNSDGELVIPSKIEGYPVVSIASSAFTADASLVSVILPDTLRIIGDSAFSNCDYLMDIVIPDSVTTINANAFYSCDSLQTVNMSRNLEYMGTSAFEQCQFLKCIELPDSLTYMGSYCFYNCIGLERVTLSKNCNDIGSYSFYNCDSLTSIFIPACVQLANGSFQLCDNLFDITFEDGLQAIPPRMFSYCPAVPSLVIPGSVQVIGTYAFYGCASLVDVIIEDGGHSIEESAFGSCNADLMVTIPPSVTDISPFAFSNTSSLTILGVAGSYAEEYANSIGAMFVEIEEDGGELRLEEKEISMSVGDNAYVVPVTYPDDLSIPLVWSSDNTSVAIYNNGVVTAVGQGSTTVRLTYGDQEASCVVNVINESTQVTVTPFICSMEAGEVFTLTAEVTPSVVANQRLEWSTSDPDIAFVDALGRVTAVGEGTATIVATATDGSGAYGSCDINVSGTAIFCSSILDLESSHNYDNNMRTTWVYTLPNADGLILTFDPYTEFETSYDNLYIYDGNFNLVDIFTGTSLAGATITVPGNTVRLKLFSDLSVTKWGFRVNSINADHMHTVVTDNGILATCRREGLTEGSHCSTCGKVLEEQQVIPRSKHIGVSISGTEPTCTEPGTTEGWRCFYCGKVLTPQYSIAKLGHKKVVDAAVAATCTKSGLTKGSHCSVCDTVFTAQKVIPATGHTKVTDAAVAATCTKSGLTKGVHCSVCKKVLTAQNVIPATGHTKVTSPAVAATCTKSGLTKGVTCSVCNKVLTVQEVIPATGHTKVTDPAVAPTCTKSGLTKGVHCSVCNKVLTAQTEVPKLGHTRVTDPAVKPTCVKVGLTEGVHCSTCNKVIVAQTEIPMVAHKEVVDPAVAATCTEPGYTKGSHCSVCNLVFVAQRKIAAKGHIKVTDKAVEPTCTSTGLTAGTHCSVCQKTITAQQVVEKLPHTVVTDKAVAATCTKSGLTKGTHCSVCNTVLTAQKKVAAKGHTEVVDLAVAPTCTAVGLTEGSHCSVCKKVLIAQEEIPMTPHKFSKGYCTVCGAVDVSPKVPACTLADVYGGVKVKATCASSGARIYYSTDSDVTTDDPYITSGKTVNFTGYYGIVYFKSYLNGYWSAVKKVTIKPETPDAPTFSKSSNVLTIKTATPDCEIWYTTDGSDPVVKSDGTSANAAKLTATSSGKFTILRDMTVKAIAVKKGCNNSSVASYSAVAMRMAAPSFKVVGVIGGRNVTFQSTDSDVSLYYSKTTSSLTTRDAKVANGGTVLFTNYYGTIYAKAYLNGQWSNVSRLILKIPVVNKPAITALGSGKVKIATSTPSCAIYYTTDGTTPSLTNGKRISASSGEVYVGAGKTVKAIAVRSCFTNSDVATATSK